MAALLAGCAPRTAPVEDPVEVPPAFSRSGPDSLPDRWWTAFGDERLNALVDTALLSNFDILSAYERLQAARAIVDRESATLLPSLDGSLRGEIRRGQTDFQDLEALELGLGASYEVDLWGRLRSRVEAEQFRAAATRSDYQAAAITLSAELARSWYELLEAQNQLQLVEEQIETNEKVLRSLEARFGIGQVRSADILRQRELLEASREQKTYIEPRIRLLENRISVLLGRPPQEDVQYQSQPLPGLPPLPETGVPAELVERRPDVRSAFYRLQASDRDLAAAISNQYPRLSLSASLSTAADNANNIFRDWAYSFAGNLFAPLFYGGELRAEVDRNEAARNQRLFEYGRSILMAFREVEDALVLEQNQRESIESLQTQIRLARRSYERLREEYFNGIADYLDVLTALEREQQLRRTLLSAQLALIDYRILLYRALAGRVVEG